MRSTAATALVLAALFPQAAHAAGSEQRALAGLAKAVAAGRLLPGQSAADRVQVRRAASLWKKLPSARGAALKAVLDDVAALAGSYTAPRAAALFGELKANADYLATHAVLGRPGQDITDSDGVVYRYFPGHGFQFHPLGNMGALNAAVASGDLERTRRLADALIARSVGGVWEYYFSYSGGRPPWASGMAQAVAAQAFARAGSALGEPAYTAAARRAFATIPGRLVRARPGGPWIRLYSFTNAVVLNAQLQSVLSLGDYASLTGDAAAAALANSMRTAAVSQLAQFDTGFWSYYALPGDDSSLDYHLYVVSLLQKLAKQDARFAGAATRFLAYTMQPPAFKLGENSFWLSKPGTVSISIGSATHTLGLSAGWHPISARLGPRAALLPVHLAATDYAGNRAAADALPLVHAELALRAFAAAGQPEFVVGTGDPAQASAGFGELRVTNPATPVSSALPLALEFTSAPDPAFVLSLVQQSHGVRDVIVPAQSAAAVRDALAGAARVAGSISDPAALAELGAAFKTSGRTQPALDELAYSGPSLPDYTALVAALGAAFDGTPQPGSALSILYTHLKDSAALRATACQPTAAGAFLDGPADPALVKQAQRGILAVCPGLAVPGAVSTVVFPTQPVSRWSLQLACPRDCLYLATLERVRDGVPMLARRGSLRGGTAPVTVTLPALPVPAGSYRLVVRVVPQVNPGAILMQQSGDLTVG
jgi:D-glucuronyl C5-epimerase C-terminus